MKFIIDTHDLEVSKSMIETLLENELDNPISVKEVKEINEEELDELAYDTFPKLYVPISGEGLVDTNEDFREAFKLGCRKALEK